MKKVYTLLAVSLFLSTLFSSCSKDALKPYEDRIIGTWQITGVDRRGIGPSRTLVFTQGDLTFTSDRKLVYVDGTGRTFNGSWDVRKDIRLNCANTIDGNCTNERVQMLQITAVDFTAQEVRSEVFDDLQFTSTNRLNAFIFSGARTYIVRLVRR